MIWVIKHLVADQKKEGGQPTAFSDAHCQSTMEKCTIFVVHIWRTGWIKITTSRLFFSSTFIHCSNKMVRLFIIAIHYPIPIFFVPSISQFDCYTPNKQYVSMYMYRRFYIYFSIYIFTHSVSTNSHHKTNQQISYPNLSATTADHHPFLSPTLFVNTLYIFIQ